MIRRSKTTRIIVWFIVLMSIGWAFYRVGSPFAKTTVKGATEVKNIQNILYSWDLAKKSNYNTKYEIVIKINPEEITTDSLSFLLDYVRSYNGVKLNSGSEYLLRIPTEESDKFYKRIEKLGNITSYSIDSSTSLGTKTIKYYTDSLSTLNNQKLALKKAKKENKNIKGYDDDIAEVDRKIGRIQKLKDSLGNQNYDLYLVSFYQKVFKGFGKSYIITYLREFVIGLGVLALAIPLIFLGFRLIFKLVGYINVNSGGSYGGYYSKGYKYGSYGSGYGSYGRKRKVKRIYKDNDGKRKEEDSK